MARQHVGDHAPRATAGSPDRSVQARPSGTDPLPGRWWLWPLVIYLGTRLVNAVMIVIASNSSITLEEFVGSGHLHFGTDAGTAPPGYLTTVTRWDGQWYWEIAARGYPSELPTDASGNVEQNPWAFFPLYPYVVRGVMFVTRLDFPLASVAVSLVAGAVAMLLLYRLVARRHGPVGGIIAVLAMSTFICAPVMQISYTEGLALALVLAVITCVTRQRYWWAALALLFLGLTRGVAVAFAPALVVYAFLLWRQGSLSRRRTVALGLLAVWSGLVGVIWPVIVGVSTGMPRAYLLTQQAWNPELTSTPIARFLERNSDMPGGVTTAAVVAAVWAVLLIWLFTLGQQEPMLRAWTIAYIVYVLAVVDWNWSAVRYYLLAIPVFWPLVRAGVPEDRPRQRVLVAVVFALVGVAAQWWWIRYCLVISRELVQVP